MKNFNEKKFIDELLNQHWDYVYFFGDDPNAMWEIWKELFLEVLDKHAPLQQKKVRSTGCIKKKLNRFEIALNSAKQLLLSSF